MRPRLYPASPLWWADAAGRKVVRYGSPWGTDALGPHGGFAVPIPLSPTLSNRGPDRGRNPRRLSPATAEEADGGAEDIGGAEAAGLGDDGKVRMLTAYHLAPGDAGLHL